MHTDAGRLALALAGLLVLTCTEPATVNNDPTITTLDLPVTLEAGYSTTFFCSASDPDGDPLTCDWWCSAGSLRPSTGTAVVWTAPETSCLVRVMVNVADGRDGTATRYDTVAVSPGRTSIVEWSGAIGAGEYQLWYNSFHAGSSVIGKFSAGDQAITFIMLDSVNYLKWRHNERCSCEVRIDSSAGSDFAFNISTAGLHCFVLDNTRNKQADTTLYIFVQRATP